MKIYLKGHDLEFATQQIYMCMFPGLHAEFVPLEPNEGDYIVSSLEVLGEELVSQTEMHLGGKEVVKTATEPYPKTDDCEEIKRAKRRAVKTSLYLASVEFLPQKPAWGALTGIRPSKVAIKYLEDGKSAEETIELMQSDYFVSPERAKLATTCAVRARELSKKASRHDVSLYVGIPFCASRCKYCSFVSHSVEKARHLISPYLEMLRSEIELLGRAVREVGLNLASVYIGGGTPTALSNDELRFVMECIARNFDIKNVPEYTVEGGRPDTLSREKIKTIRSLGATRISVNPQTMNDGILKAMDRRHTADDVVRAIGDVRNVGGLVINTDLIAGLPGDDLKSFENSIDRVVELDPENITVHTLALKKGSSLRREGAGIPNGDVTAEMVNYALSLLGEKGYVPYYLYRQKYMSGNLENVGYSKPGFENLYNNYIMDELHTILSAGAGGVTKLIDKGAGKIERIFNPKYPYEYNNAEEKIKETEKRIKEFF